MTAIPYLKRGFIFGDRWRLFINTALGCPSSCSYCYLPSVGIKIGDTPDNVVAAEEIINTLEGQDYEVVRGKFGTIFSIGCYSECWDSRNLPQTLTLIDRLLEWGNPIQVATKRRIRIKQLGGLSRNIAWKGQLTIYISCSSIAKWRAWEPGTAAPIERFTGFAAANEHSIPAYLYIKPVIEGVTITDVEEYNSVIQKFNVDCVVGDMFTTVPSSLSAPIGNGVLYVKESDEVVRLSQELAKQCRVFRNSTEVIEMWRAR